MSVLRRPHVGPHSGIRTPNKAFTGGAAPSAYSATVLADNPLLYWRLGEVSGTVAADASGNARPGTYGAGVTLNQAGLVSGDSDKAISMAGAGGTTGVITSAYTPWSATNTFEALLAPAASGVRRNIIGGSNTFGPVLYVDATNTPNWFPDNSGSGVVWLAGDIPNATCHVALTFDDPGNVVELFVNGVSKGTRSTIATYSGTPGTFQFGTFGTNASGYNGVGDEVAVYGTILSAARIAAHNAAR